MQRSTLLCFLSILAAAAGASISEQIAQQLGNALPAIPGVNRPISGVQFLPRDEETVRQASSLVDQLAELARRRDDDSSSDSSSSSESEEGRRPPSPGGRPPRPPVGPGGRPPKPVGPGGRPPKPVGPGGRPPKPVGPGDHKPPKPTKPPGSSPRPPPASSSVRPSDASGSTSAPVSDSNASGSTSAPVSDSNAGESSNSQGSDSNAGESSNSQGSESSDSTGGRVTRASVPVIPGLPAFPDVNELIPELPSGGNSNVRVPPIRQERSLSSSQSNLVNTALNEARSRVQAALNITGNFVDGLQLALQQAFEGENPTAAIRTIVNTVLNIYLDVALNCPALVIGVRVATEGIRLAGEVAQSARNVIFGNK